MTLQRWILLSFLAYIAGIALLGDWIIDDAGISFAYARNVAMGHGFVSQPGRVPVEGFSNFLWVLLYVPWFWIGAFEPIWLPKVVAALLMLGSISMIQTVLSEATGKLWPGWLASLFIATSPPIVVWTASGLENSLLLLLVVALWMFVTVRPCGWEVAAGALAGLLALTRPDGILYVVVVPLVATAEWVRGGTKLRAGLLQALRGVGAFLLVWTPFLVFRLLRFGLPFPHTYYAKLEFVDSADRLRALLGESARALRAKLWQLGEGIAGPIGPWLIAACLAVTLVLAWQRRLSRAAATAFLLLVVATGAHLWLSEDWMGEFRFATAAVAMAWIYLFTVAQGVLEQAPRWLQRKAAPILGIAVAVAVLPGSVLRLVRFASNPPVPLRSVERQYAHRFNAYADALGVSHGSILIADIGAMLLESRLTVYDVAGLTEPTVVRTLRAGTPTWRYDHPQFYQWIFEEIRPTFVVTSGFWTNVTALEEDARFVRDYVAIDSFPDAYIKEWYHRDLRSGEFVRRDALERTGAWEAMLASFAFSRPIEPLVYRIADGFGSWCSGAPFAAPELRSKAAASLTFPAPDPNRAAALMVQLVDRAPDDLDARARLASALDQAGRSSEARVEWELVALRAAALGATELVTRAHLRLAGAESGSGQL